MCVRTSVNKKCSVIGPSSVIIIGFMYNWRLTILGPVWKVFTLVLMGVDMLASSVASLLREQEIK